MEARSIAHFLVRVELHNSSSADYAVLHEAMKKSFYSRQITSGDGQSFGLPSAMYVFVGKGEPNFIRKEVLEIARKVKPKPDPWVIVVEFSDTSWWLQKHSS